MDIAFLMLPERGGFYPTFVLAKALRARGHTVRYYGVVDFADDVRRQGLEYHTLFEDAYAPAFFDPPPASAGPWARFQARRQRMARPGKHRFQAALADGELASILRAHGTDLVLLDPLMAPATAPLVAAGLRVVSVATELIGRGFSVPPNHSGFVPRDRALHRLWTRALWLGQLAGVYRWRLQRASRNLVNSALDPERGLRRAIDARLGALERQVALPRAFSEHGFRPVIDELLLCPRALDFPHADPTRMYAGPSIDLERREVDLPWSRIDGDARELVLVSLGTRAALYGARPDRLFAHVYELAARRPELLFVVVLGIGRPADRFGVPPANVVAVERAPQLALLRRARVMITNGGLGTVKECIWFRVPMVVVPCAVDQAGNSARVVYHGLGVRDDVGAGADRLEAHIDHCRTSAEIASALARMSEAFHDDREQTRALDWLERRAP